MTLETIDGLVAKVATEPDDQTAWLVLADAYDEADLGYIADFVREHVGYLVIENGSPVAYRLDMFDECGGSENEYQRGRPTSDDCDEFARDWCREGDWGNDGAEIGLSWELVRETPDGEEEIESGYCTCEIDPDHRALISKAVGRWGDPADRCCGMDPDDHDWTNEGEGGLDENPGVWSNGGTSMIYASHCRRCGLHRQEVVLGAQRNPGDHDTTTYTMPDTWCADCQSEECTCEETRS